MPHGKNITAHAERISRCRGLK